MCAKGVKCRVGEKEPLRWSGHTEMIKNEEFVKKKVSLSENKGVKREIGKVGPPWETKRYNSGVRVKEAYIEEEDLNKQRGNV